MAGHSKRDIERSFGPPDSSGASQIDGPWSEYIRFNRYKLVFTFSADDTLNSVQYRLLDSKPFPNDNAAAEAEDLEKKIPEK
ncbi:MAG: hypothetical protein ACI8W8_004813 [Rhodothermales bacterium]|jgi:hypothetical protein